jgi:hypothetical protein
MRAEWRGRSAFAEVAEALGVRSDQVMAVTELRGQVVALFTYDDDETLIFATTLKRGVDDVLIVASTPEPRPGLWEQIVEDAERGR